jgi:leader peptidase (prepilin peptidase) / N-methyltransferase
MEYFLIVSFSLFSLLLGSFFTVLIYRLPLMLQEQWRKNSQQFLSQENLMLINEKTFNIFLPFSHCPNCHEYLTILQKIPLLSYFFLKRRCAYCQVRISFCYPLIEIITLISSLIVIERFGISLQTFAALVLTWGLLILAFIDLERKILPDIITFPLLWCGLLSSTMQVFVSPEAAILGACFAYLFLYVLAKCYQLLAKIEPMGEGDFKFFALLGAWLGIKALPYILFIAAGVGSIVGIALYLSNKDNLRKGIAFGPYLALSGWLVLIGCFYN